jgi:Fe-S-cluster-containing hydrogenase component 2
VADINRIDILGEELEKVVEEPFQLPATSLARKIPHPMINLAKKFIKYYPCVDEDNCLNCTACIQACPNKAISMQNNRIVFDYAKCISCFCCQEACSASAIKVKKSLLAKIVSLVYE